MAAYKFAAFFGFTFLHLFFMCLMHCTQASDSAARIYCFWCQIQSLPLDNKLQRIVNDLHTICFLGVFASCMLDYSILKWLRRTLIIMQAICKTMVQDHERSAMLG